MESIEQKKSIYNIINDSTPAELSGIVGQKNARTLKVFLASVMDLQDVLKDSKMRFLDLFEETFDFKEQYHGIPDGYDKIANIDEFYGYIRDFFIQNPDAKLDELDRKSVV